MEIWKNIKGYKGYQVSNLGRIKSLRRFVLKTNGVEMEVKEKILKGGIASHGYLTINLCSNKVCANHTIHSLVVNTFINNVLNKRTVNHKDGNKLNNKLSNLEWATVSENVQHAYNTGLNYAHNLWKKVLMMTLDNEPLLWFDSITEASVMTNTYYTSITKCCKGKQKTAGGYKWKHYNEEELLCKSY